MRHKHADVFEAAARGEADEFEVMYVDWGKNDWAPVRSKLSFLYDEPSEWICRRKQKTHVVNGFTVPEPLRDTPQVGTIYFVESSIYDSFYDQCKWLGHKADELFAARGIAHATRESAIANCKARLGIDPYKDES